MDRDANPVSQAQRGAILDLIGDGTISGKIAKDVFEIVWGDGGDPRTIVEQRGLKQVTDLSAIEKIVEDEATGSAAVMLTARLERPLTIHQGEGSELFTHSLGSGRAEVGGRVVLDEIREL